MFNETYAQRASMSLTMREACKELASKIGVEQLSMGMSADYIQASNLGSTFIRVGSNIFGERFKKF